MLSKTKFRENIVTELQSNLFFAPGEKLEEGDNPIILNLDEDVVKGAFLVQAAWDMPGKVPTKADIGRDELSHKHDFDEVLGFFGSDPQNPHDLGAELAAAIPGPDNPQAIDLSGRSRVH
jgi:hypothetical protein